MKRKKDIVILGVTKSDAHVVANNLIYHFLKENGFQIVNLGCCTPIKEFMEAYLHNRDALAIVIGTLNGHALEDLETLKIAKQIHQVSCPVFLGGNLSVGSLKKFGLEEEFFKLGVDKIINTPRELLRELLQLKQHRYQQTDLFPPDRKEKSYAAAQI